MYPAPKIAQPKTQIVSDNLSPLYYKSVGITARANFDDAVSPSHSSSDAALQQLHRRHDALRERLRLTLGLAPLRLAK